MVDPTTSHAFNVRMQKLTAAYSMRLKGEFEQLKRIAERLTEKPSCPKSLQQLNSALHSLAGSAGTFGYVQLGRQAREHEQMVAKVVELPADASQPLPVTQWVSQLEKALETDENQKTAVCIETSKVGNVEGEPSIWLIERDAMLADYMIQQLHSFGFRVRHMNDAQELDQEKNTLPDLILVDHRATQLANRQANPVTVWQRHLNRFTCPVLFTGTEESFTARLHALRSGGVNYFVKPLDTIKLASYMAQLIKSTDSMPERVMVIEDDVELAQYIQSILEEAGMQVSVLEHPVVLFEAINEFNPELILMDLWLPDVTGAELAALLRQLERWSELPIVYVSAEPNAGLRGQALLKGGDAFLEKPIDTDLLINLCRTRVKRLRKLEQTKNRDGLTGLLKHASIKEALQDQWQLTQRKSQAFCVVMLDIDHFKSVNDTHGHAVGDLVIAAVGTLLRQRFRSTDKLGRYGGEEFTLVLIDCTANNALLMVNTLREDFAAIKFTGGGERFSCTLSAGVVDNKNFPDDSADELLNRADQALYHAKNSGRNRVCLAAE